MAKSKEVFICQNCGAASPKWQGQCAGCGEWNTLVAEAAVDRIANSLPVARSRSAAMPRSSWPPRPHRAAPAANRLRRSLTGCSGGGLVPGSVTLIGGDPGIGKSTLMLQAAAALQWRAARCCMPPARNP